MTSPRTRILLAALAATTAACSDAVEPPAVTPPPLPHQPPVAAEYVVRPPEGKLPWPHHEPGWDAARYQRMLDDIWVINNFGQYQGGTQLEQIYFHDALDIVIPSGSPIHAVKSGHVRANIGGDEYYRTLIIEDEDQPGFGWSYTHVYHFTVRPGDYVKQGTKIGVVHFRGIEHIHLSRSRLRPGGDWSVFADVYTLHPDGYFVFRDTEPPVFDGEFRYVRNLSDIAFRPDSTGLVTVSGDVDVVVGLRDGGEWTRSPGPWAGPTPYGSRHSPMRIEYDIEAPDGTVHSRVALDWRKIMLPYAFIPATRVSNTLAVYQFYHYVSSPTAPAVGNNNAVFGYFIITNADGLEHALRLVDAGESLHAWRTAATHADGRAVYPNGEYRITVRAYDASGNVAERTGAVRVQN